MLAALLEARTSGRGQVVDAAIVDGTAHLSSLVVGLVSAGLWSDRRGTNLLDTGAPFYDVYETSDGGWLAVGPLEPAFYAELLRLLDLTDAAPDRLDPRQWPALRALLADTFRTRTPRRVDRPPRGHRRVRRAGPQLRRGARTTRTSPPAAPTSSTTASSSRHPAPRFSRTPAALGTPPSTPGRRHPGGPRRRGASTTSTPSSPPAPRSRP